MPNSFFTSGIRWLAAHRLRLLFRISFLMLILGGITMVITLLQEEKQRSTNNYQASFLKTKAQIVSRLHHPSGLLALMNPHWQGDSGGEPVVLPFSAIDFDDQNKVRNAIEMANCLIAYRHGGSLCVGVGNNPWAGGFIYAAGTFTSQALEPHRIGNPILDTAHRLRVSVTFKGKSWHWIAPFEPLPPAEPARGAEGVRGRFTGYVEQPSRDYKGARPIREFRAWIWQSGQCIDPKSDEENCHKSSFFSMRLPVPSLTESIFSRPRGDIEWPPRDLSQYRVRVEILPPGEEVSAIFDSQSPPAARPFSLSEISQLLLPGETLTIRKVGSNERDVFSFSGRDDSVEQVSPLLTRIIRFLPVVDLSPSAVEFSDEIRTPLGNYELSFKGDARSVNKALSIVATRLSGFFLGMLGAVMLVWFVIEISIVRRISALSNRTEGLSRSVQSKAVLEHYERFNLSDLCSRDELGRLASGLDELLRRVKDDARRERIRAEQEKDMWHAVGHEIMSPLQSLIVLHGHPSDPSFHYISRMQQAVRILYGNASPSEAFQSSDLDLETLDIALFIATAVKSADILGLRCEGVADPVFVSGNAYSLEDVFSHLLHNAERYRTPDTPITLSLSTDTETVSIRFHNEGPIIPEALLPKIFEYGVSDNLDETGGHRGQGLFVAKTYMAKMGGTIHAMNDPDGVSFILTLPRLDAPHRSENA